MTAFAGGAAGSSRDPSTCGHPVAGDDHETDDLDGFEPKGIQEHEVERDHLGADVLLAEHLLSAFVVDVRCRVLNSALDDVGPSVALEASVEPLLAVVLGDKWRGTPPPDDKIFIAGNGMTGKKLLERGRKLKLEVFDNTDV